MTTTLSDVVPANRRAIPGFESLIHVELDALGVAGNPVTMFDDFAVSDMPFAPHPHAGFAAVTYVFPDSPGASRSRASNGTDLTVGAGGIVWTEAAHGIVHEEVPAPMGTTLHGIQVFVNLSAEHKHDEPTVHHLMPEEVTRWTGQDGTDVRVVVGSFEDASSSLVPTEPFTLLDIDLHGSVDLPVGADQTAVIYVREGSAVVAVGDQRREVHAPATVAVQQGGEPVTVSTDSHALVLLLAGQRNDEPVVVEGSFIMNTRAEIDDAVARYRRGEMGVLLED